MKLKARPSRCDSKAVGVHGRQAPVSCSTQVFREVNAALKRKCKRCFFCAQELQEEAGKGEELWASVDKSYQSLVKTLHRGTAQDLDDQREGERQRSAA